MSIIPIIPPYVAPYKPMNNITPFTYQDGLTFLEKLESISGYLSHDIVDFVNQNFETLGNEFEDQANDLIDTVNSQLATAIATVVGNSVTVQDPVIAAAVNNVSSLTRAALDDLYSPANVADGSVAGVIIDSGSLSRAALNARFVQLDHTANIVHGTDGSANESSIPVASAATANAIIKRDAAGRAQIVNPSAAADITNKVTSEAAATAAAAAATTGAALDTTVSGLLTSGTATHPNLISIIDAEASGFAATQVAALLSGGNAFKRYANIGALPTSGQSTGVIALVDSVPGAFFYYTSATTYKMYGIARFASAAARDAAITAPVQGMQAFIADWDCVTQYSDIYNSSTNLTGRTIAGWYPVVTDLQRFFALTMTGTTTVGGTAGTFVIKRRPYAQRIVVRYNGYIAGTTTGGLSLAASTGGTPTAGGGFAAIAVTGAASAYAPANTVDIAAGAGADVTLTLAAIGGGTITLAGLLTAEIMVAGEY